MKTTVLGHSDIESSRLVYGCMRIAGDNSASDREKGKRAIRAAIDAGYNHFDHADIYGGGECERLFGEVLAEEPGLRDRLIITSKCGIRFGDDPEPGDPTPADADPGGGAGGSEGSSGGVRAALIFRRRLEGGAPVPPRR